MINLAWDASTWTTLAGYKLYYGTAKGAYGTPVNVGKVLAYSVPINSPGSYFLAVTAFDTAGKESGFSNEVAVSVGPSGMAISSNIARGDILKDKVDWITPVSGGVPSSVDYFIDGVKLWQENSPPYWFNGNDNKLDTTTLSDGPHMLKAVAHLAGAPDAAVTVPVIVVNAPPSKDILILNTRLSVPSVLPSGLVTVLYDVKNAGTAAITEVYTEDIILTTPTLLGGVRLGTFAHTEDLAPGQVRSYSRILVIPFNTVPYKDYRILVIGDVKQLVTESNETNNLGQAALEVR